MKVAIIGANGYIGENLSKYLDNNYEVINVRHNGHVWTVLRNKKDSTYYGAYHLPDCGCR